MRIKFTLILLLFALSLTAQPKHPAWSDSWLKRDKAMHTACSASISMLATLSANDYKIKSPELWGIGVSLAVGIGKEFLVDGSPDAYDLTAEIFGAFVGVAIIKAGKLLRNEIQKKVHIGK